MVRLYFRFFYTAIIAAFVMAVAVCFSFGASANQELDRKYSLGTVVLLRASDNVDGLFADHVASAYREYFSYQSRFIIRDVSKANAVISKSKLPYSNLVSDVDVLGQLAIAVKAETVIRTRIIKETDGYKFTIDLLLAPRMDVISTESFILSEPPTGSSISELGIKTPVQEALDRLISKIPFIGGVTGIDNGTVLVNIGERALLQKGDTLLVSTLDGIKRHPLLSEVSEWRLAPTGRIVVESVEENMAFCRILEEEPGQKIDRYQKIVRIDKADTATNKVGLNEESPQWKPRNGWVAAGVGIGSFSRQYSSSSNQTGKNGNGTFFGPDIDSQIWLTSKWFAEIGFTYGFWKYSQVNLPSGQDTGAAKVSSYILGSRVGVGYTYLLTSDFFGPKGWIKIGYQGRNYSFPVSSSEQTSPFSVSSVSLGLGGDVPIRDKWSVLLNIDFGLFSSGNAPGGVLPKVDSASHVSLFVGTLYNWSARMAIRGGLSVLANGAEFSEQGTSLSHRIVAITPALLYYF
ncbi:MAG: hypothetical protein AABZ06_07410 [Bdellovibrionota bacterium]